MNFQSGKEKLGSSGQYWSLGLVCALVWCLSTQTAWAATGEEFKDLYDLIHGWASGYLGQAIALAFLLVGLGMGLIRGSVVAAVTCIGASVSLVMLPTIVETMFGIA